MIQTVLILVTDTYATVERCIGYLTRLGYSVENIDENTEFENNQYTCTGCLEVSVPDDSIEIDGLREQVRGWFREEDLVYFSIVFLDVTKWDGYAMTWDGIGNLPEAKASEKRSTWYSKLKEPS